MSLVQSGSASPRVAYASELGCALNSNLGSGGGSDDTAILNAFLASASANNPIKLIIDGVALISGLAISPNGYTTIEGLGWGTGFYNASGNGNIIISNGYPPTTGNSTPPSITCTNISLRNFTLNGNANGNTNNPVSYGVCIINALNVELDSVYIENVAQFCTRFDNVVNLRVNGCGFATGSYLQDGVHVDGPAQFVTISNCYFATGDDAIALNAPEGYGGDITDVVVTNCVFNDSLSACRIYPSNRSILFHVKRVSISNLSGTNKATSFNFGIEESQSQSAPGQLSDIVLSNIDLTAPGNFLNLTAPSGAVSLSNCIFRAPANANAMVVAAWLTDDLSMDNCTIVRNADGNAAAYFVDVGSVGGTSGRVTLSNLRMANLGGTSYSAANFLANVYGPLTELHVNDVNMDSFTSFFNGSQQSNITTFSGSGWLSTGTQLNDSQVANNVLYLSATSGKPSIKVGGTVNALY